MEAKAFENVEDQIGYCGLWCGSCVGSVVHRLRKGSATANNIKDKDTQKKVLKALGKLLLGLPSLNVGNGFVAFGLMMEFEYSDRLGL